MAYPNTTEVTADATTLGVDPIEIYAFAAMHERLPSGRSELQPFEVSVATSGSFFIPGLGEPIVYRYAYIQAHGGFPAASWQYQNWLVQQGYLTIDPATHLPYLSSAYPFAGEGYPPGNQPTDASTPAPTSPSPSGTGQTGTGTSILAGLHVSPLVLAGGALVGAWALGLFKRR